MVITLLSDNQTYSSGLSGSNERTYNFADPQNFIPKYSIINSATVSIQVSSSLSSKGDIELKVNGTTVLDRDNAVGNSYTTQSASFLNLISTSGSNAGRISPQQFTCRLTATVIRKWNQRNARVEMDITLPTFKLNVLSNNTKYGTVSGGGTFDIVPNDQKKIITATPKDGYRFVRWSDGNTEPTRTIIVSQNSISAHSTNVNYTAEFAPNPIVSFDSIFSFLKWKKVGITTSYGSNASLSESETGFSITSRIDNEVFTDTSPRISVEPNKSYTLKVNASGNARELFIFFHESTNDGGWISLINTDKTEIKFVTPSNCHYIDIRVDSNANGQISTYSDFRIFPSDCSYMGETVSSDKRSCCGLWNFPPSPTRQGYKFLGWFDSPTGGTQYTANSPFPASDMVLYSHWEAENQPPKIGSVQMTYGNTLISQLNKVVVSQSFLIAVNIT